MTARILYPKVPAEEREEGVPLHGIRKEMTDVLRVGDDLQAPMLRERVSVTDENIEALAERLNERGPYNRFTGWAISRDETARKSDE